MTFVVSDMFTSLREFDNCILKMESSSNTGINYTVFLFDFYVFSERYEVEPNPEKLLIKNITRIFYKRLKLKTVPIRSDTKLMLVINCHNLFAN